MCSALVPVGKPRQIQHQVLRLCQALNSSGAESRPQRKPAPGTYDSLEDSLEGSPARLSDASPSDRVTGSSSWSSAYFLQQEQQGQHLYGSGRGNGRWRRGEGDEGEEGEQWRSGQAAVIGYGETEALAYVCARMPSCYAATTRVLNEVRAAPSLQLCCRHQCCYVHVCLASAVQDVKCWMCLPLPTVFMRCRSV